MGTDAATESLVAPDSGAASDMAREQRTIAGESVIRTGDISIVVDDTAAAADRVSEIVDGLGGYVEAESVYGGSGSSEASAVLTVRVPSERFADAFDALGEVGDVSSQSQSAVDVTMEHVDLQARVEALEESVERLKELIRGATTTSELIEAESALTQRQQDLDGLRAQLTALEDQVGQSTIWVSLSTASPIAGGPANFWEGLLLGIGSIGDALAVGLVTFGVALPWLVVLAAVAAIVLLIVWLSMRGGRRRREARAAQAQARAAQSQAEAAHAAPPAPEGPLPPLV